MIFSLSFVGSQQFNSTRESMSMFEMETEVTRGWLLMTRWIVFWTVGVTHWSEESKWETVNATKFWIGATAKFYGV